MVCGETREMVSFITFPGQRSNVRTHRPPHALKSIISTPGPLWSLFLSRETVYLKE